MPEKEIRLRGRKWLGPIFCNAALGPQSTIHVEFTSETHSSTILHTNQTTKQTRFQRVEMRHLEAAVLPTTRRAKKNRAYDARG
jgi:hypothetical protein